jgi:hypothetical protein
LVLVPDIPPPAIAGLESLAASYSIEVDNDRHGVKRVRWSAAWRRPARGSTFFVAAPAGADKRARMVEGAGHSFRNNLSMRDIISAAQVTTVSGLVQVHDWAA